jgi:hypothetical protein
MNRYPTPGERLDFPVRLHPVRQQGTGGIAVHSAYRRLASLLSRTETLPRFYVCSAEVVACMMVGDMGAKYNFDSTHHLARSAG